MTLSIHQLCPARVSTVSYASHGLGEPLVLTPMYGLHVHDAWIDCPTTCFATTLHEFTCIRSVTPAP